MKFARAAIRAAVTAALDAHRTAHEERTADWAAAVHAHREAHLREYGARWEFAAYRIMAKAENGEPITAADMPADSSHRPALYATPSYRLRLDGRDVNDPGPYRAPAELRALGEVLDAVTDDEVTVTALRALGITSATLREALGQLGRQAA